MPKLICKKCQHPFVLPAGQTERLDACPACGESVLVPALHAQPALPSPARRGVALVARVALALIAGYFTLGNPSTGVALVGYGAMAWGLFGVARFLQTCYPAQRWFPRVALMAIVTGLGMLAWFDTYQLATKSFSGDDGFADSVVSYRRLAGIPYHVTTTGLIWPHQGALAQARVSGPLDWQGRPHGKFRVRLMNWPQLAPQSAWYWHDQRVTQEQWQRFQRDPALAAELKDEPGRPVDRDLVMAIDQQDVEAVKRLIAAGVNVNSVSEGGYTPLHGAAHRSNLEIAKILLAAGADLDAQSEEEETPTVVAVYAGEPAMVHLFLERGADLERATSLGVTPLIAAVQQHRADMAIDLIDHGANVNARQDAQHPTVLMLAVEREQEAVVKRLLQQGADAGIRLDDGTSALDLAKSDAMRKLLTSAGQETKNEP